MLNVNYKQFPIFGNPQLMRLFRYLPPYKKYIIGAALAMIAGGGASSLIALVLGLSILLLLLYLVFQYYMAAVSTLANFSWCVLRKE